MRTLLYLAATLCTGLLAGCTSDGSSALEELGPLAEEIILGPGEPPPPAPPITRATLDAVPFATIAISAPGQPRAFVAAVADNGGFVSYQDQLRRSIVLEGGLVVATKGLGYNLSAVKHQLDDPVAIPTPAADWPTTVVRNYQFALVGAEDYQVTVGCQIQQAARERIEIVELDFDVMRVEETCGNGLRTFTNTYWVDPETGFIWKSVQWIGPRQPDPLVIEVIRPFG